MADKPRRKLTVLSLEVEQEGIGRNNQPYKRYSVSALGEDGLPIQERLQTFDGELPLNELVDYEIVKRDDQRHGTTFTISVPGKRGKSLPESVDELRGMVRDLQARVGRLESGTSSQLQSAATPPGDAPIL